MSAGSSRPGPKPRLTPEAIATATVTLADSAGLAAVSMARVAERLGFATMALYRHVATKDALLALAVDTAIGPVPMSGETDWRVSLRRWATDCLEVFHRHRWLLAATAQPGRPMGPNETTWVDAVLTALQRAGLDDEQRHDVALALLGQVRVVAQFADDRARLDFGVRCLLTGLDRLAAPGG